MTSPLPGNSQTSPLWDNDNNDLQAVNDFDGD